MKDLLIEDGSQNKGATAVCLVKCILIVQCIRLSSVKGNSEIKPVSYFLKKMKPLILFSLKNTPGTAGSSSFTTNHCVLAARPAF